MDYFNIKDIESKEQHITVKFKKETEGIKKNKKISLPFYILDFLIENEYCEIIQFEDFIISEYQINEMKADYLTDLSNISFSTLNKSKNNKYFFRFIQHLFFTGEVKKNIFDFYNLMCKRIQFIGQYLFNIDICIKGKGVSSKVILDFDDIDFNDSHKQISVSENQEKNLDADEKDLLNKSKKQFMKFRLL